MAHPTLPFLKNKKSIPTLALPAPGDLMMPLSFPHLKHNSVVKCPNPIDTTVKWKPSPVQVIMHEYQAMSPSARLPTLSDLLLWAYDRAKNAEATIEILRQEVRILENGLHGI